MRSVMALRVGIAVVAQVTVADFFGVTALEIVICLPLLSDPRRRSHGAPRPDQFAREA